MNRNKAQVQQVSARNQNQGVIKQIRGTSLPAIGA